jgi:hypothetical protein
MPPANLDQEKNPFTSAGDLQDESDMEQVLIDQYEDEDPEFSANELYGDVLDDEPPAR